MKTITRGDFQELACQACGRELPAQRSRVVFVEETPYCSDECSEKHDEHQPTEEVARG